MSLRLILMAVTLGLGAIVFSMHGQGGGVLYAPIQVLFGVEFQQAAVRSQFFIILTSLSAVFVFRAARKVDWGLAAALETSAAAGGYLGALAAYDLPDRFLQATLGALVLVAAGLMLRPELAARLSESHPPDRGWLRSVGDARYRVNLGIGLPIWFAIGVVSGLTGTAGGFLKIPVMVLLFRMPTDVAFGTSAFMVSFTAAGGIAAHLQRGVEDWRSMLALGVFVLVGAQLGPRITLRAGGEALRRRFGWFLAAVGAITIAGIFRT